MGAIYSVSPRADLGSLGAYFQIEMNLRLARIIAALMNKVVDKEMHLEIFFVIKC